MTVAILDYGSGNLRSAAKAFERAALTSGSAETIAVTSDPDAVRRADRIVLPGVGAFADCMAGLAGIDGMLDALHDAVIEKARPFLGICVGMQLMGSRGLEHGVHRGLGWIEGVVAPIGGTGPHGESLKVPHMGWNELSFEPGVHPLLAELGPSPHFYFVHSYALDCGDPRERLATTDYGGPITAVVGRGNIAGTQFHPEKSQANGLRLIANFLAWRP
jgi:imidazole glycerol-phosphate synthase subunit HisH